MREIKIIAAAEDAGARIDKTSVNRRIYPAAGCRCWLVEGSILVNQNAVKANYKVKADDCITAVFNDEMEMEARPEKMELDVRYEDEDVIVINKPKILSCILLQEIKAGHFVNGLLYHCKDLSESMAHCVRESCIALIRIQRDCWIVAKNDLAHASLSKQLQSKTVNRLYYALVHGVIQHDFGTIDAPIGRDVKDRQKMAVTATNSKDARTHFQVIERFENYTLVECRLETGRTHQIRVHMQYIGHPVVGDEKYSYRKTMQTNGQLLHAHQLTLSASENGGSDDSGSRAAEAVCGTYWEELRQESR